MVPATKMFLDAVVNGWLVHSSDERLTRHVLNAVLKTSSRGGQIFKDSKTSPRKIDLAVASIMALERSEFYRKRTSQVLGAGDMFGDDEDPEVVMREMFEDRKALFKEAAEEREALNEFLSQKPSKQDPSGSSDKHPAG
jgi:phage terminase large subunit-like protein